MFGSRRIQSSRALDWSDSERTDALGLFRVFRESFKVALQSFDYRSLFGRASLQGNGHLLAYESRRPRMSPLTNGVRVYGSSSSR